MTRDHKSFLFAEAGTLFINVPGQLNVFNAAAGGTDEVVVMVAAGNLVSFRAVAEVNRFNNRLLF